VETGYNGQSIAHRHGVVHYTDTPSWKVAVYPEAVLPEGVTSSDERLSAKIPSAAFDMGFEPRDAYAPVACTELLTASGNAICVRGPDTSPGRWS
jgi:hypothetical protein